MVADRFDCPGSKLSSADLLSSFDVVSRVNLSKSRDSLAEFGYRSDRQDRRRVQETTTISFEGVKTRLEIFDKRKAICTSN